MMRLLGETIKVPREGQKMGIFKSSPFLLKIMEYSLCYWCHFLQKKRKKAYFSFFQEDLLKISKFNGFNFGVCSRGFLDDALFFLIFASAFFLEKHISSQFYVKYRIGYFFLEAKDLEGEFFFAGAALKRALLLSCCLLRQPAGSKPEPNCFTLYILWIETGLNVDNVSPKWI